jgi:predicted lipoprotein with Yx(FWY)xxD motif
MKRTALLLFLLFAGVILFAGCTQPQTPPVTPAPTTAIPVTPPPSSPTDTIKVTSNPQYGQILTDPAGRTLYYFARDSPYTGTSSCTGACPVTWPAFSAGTIRVTSPLKTADFGEITRPDRQKQTTYLGWPLYYYAADTSPGDTKGDGASSAWYVMSPAGVVTLEPTTAVPTTVKLIVPTTVSYSNGGY